MKSIADIYNEMEVTTPANTMGVGNPLPPTDITPGSEPICVKCKKDKKKKTVKESIFDTSDNIGKFDEEVIRDWLDNNGGCTHLKINKDLSIDASLIMIDMKESIPEYIVFNNVKHIQYNCFTDIDSINILLPKQSQQIRIHTQGVSEINLSNGTKCTEFVINGSINSLIISNKIKCEDFDVRYTKIMNIKNYPNIVTDNIKINNEYAAKLLRDNLKVKGDIYISNTCVTR
jgi:hypothetical protein